MKPWRYPVTILALAVPALFYVGIPLRWQAQKLSSFEGDEPHYLVMADALVMDHSLSVRAAYEREAERGLFYWRALDRHAYQGEHGLFGVHGAGIPVLIAPAYAWFGIPGVRALLGAIASLIPLLFFVLARRLDLGTWEALALAACASFGLPFLAASGQVYPDLVTGVLVLALACIALAQTRTRVSQPVLLLAGLLLALLPWLHLKNLTPAGVLALGILGLAAEGAGWRPGARRIVCLIALPAASLALIGWYNQFAFGSVLGPFTGGTATGASVRQAAMIFLGLHFDQTQGIFAQQPLFLLALPGLAVLARRSPSLALLLAAGYLSIIVPNAFHHNWYGGFAIAGRFMWSVAALWVIPLAFLYREVRTSRAARILFAGAGLVAVAWQIVMMKAWLAGGPRELYQVMRPDLVSRDRLLYHRWSAWMPSFYAFDRYLTYLPNLAAFAVAIALIAAGLVLARRLRPGLDLPLTRLADVAGIPAGRAGEPAAERRRVTRRWAAIVLGACVLAGAVVIGLPHPQSRDALLIDLMQRLGDAEKRPVQAAPGIFEVRPTTIAGETRSAIYVAPPTRLTWRLPVPRHASLRTAVGIDEQAWDLEGDGVVFRIAVADGRQYRELLMKPLVPREFRGDRRWLPITLDLSEFAGETIDVIFSTSPSLPGGSDARNDFAYWAKPAIYVRR